MNCFSSPFQPGKKGRQRSLGTFLLSRGGVGSATSHEMMVISLAAPRN